MPSYQYRSADGASIIAGPTLDLGQLFALLSAEVDTAFTKFCIDNIGDRKVGISPKSGVVLRRTQLGTNDGLGFILTATDPNGTISRPWGLDVDGNSLPTGAPTVTDVGGGAGVWAAGSYGVVIVAKNATGKTIASVEKVFTVGAGAVTHSFRYAWVQTPGATGYEVHRTSTPGTYGASTLIQTIGSGATVTFDDTGAAASAGTPPSDNTTGGAGPNYGTAPGIGSFSTIDITIASDPVGFAVGQQFFCYLAAKLPAGSVSIGNKRAMQIYPTEV